MANRFLLPEEALWRASATHPWLPAPAILTMEAQAKGRSEAAIIAVLEIAPSALGCNCAAWAMAA
jgi:hypothetical protein